MSNRRHAWVTAAAMLGAICLLCLGSSTGLAAANQAAVINKDVARALTEAKKHAERKQWPAALAALQEAEQSQEKSPYAEYKIEEFKGYVLTQQRKYAEAAPIFVRLTDSPQATAGDRVRHLKTAAQLYLQAKQYGQAAKAAEQGLALASGDSALLELSGQSRYLAGDYQKAALAMEKLVAATRKKGSTPEEVWLQVLLNSYDKLGDEKRIASTWEVLLRYHPRPDYWRNVLAIKTSSEQPEPLKLAYRQLMFDLGLLRSPEDYEELAMGSIEIGAAAEAVRVLQSGLEKGIFAGDREQRFRRMLTYAKDEAAKGRAFLPQQAEQARRATTGEPSVQLGRTYLGFQEYDQAIAALSSGLAKGKVDDPDQVRLYLGIAHLRKNQRKQAQDIFAAIGADSQWHDLAELWTLRAGNAKAG